jgi:large subunit ribosomal protein L32
MAVPKKRTSKAKKNARKANWKRKGYKAAQKSLSLAKSMLRGKTTSFINKAKCRPGGTLRVLAGKNLTLDVKKK